jgi:hypothetical protein
MTLQHTLGLCMLLAVAAACKKSSTPSPDAGSLQLSFTNTVKGEPLVLRQQHYTNAAGESFNITAFKYYLSNFTLTTAGGETVQAHEAYFLVSEDSAASKSITLEQLPEGDYKSISFLIGVDSARNVSGAQTGALDPVYGMFWTWNSGYIMAKLEGTSPVSPAPQQLVQFHIGGFKAPHNALRRVELAFPRQLAITSGSPPLLHLQADAYTWFDQPNRISFRETPAIHTPIEAASRVADNYQHMFSIKAN